VAAVEISGVSRRFGRTEALASTDLRIEAGEIVTVLGPSGSGKTTLLRIVGGLVAPSTGDVIVDGMAPARARAAKRVGFVPQRPALLPWRTVEDNARLLLQVNRRAGAPAGAASPVELLEQVGLGEFLGAYPHELSGGMQQRVALARALALGAPLLLMDEPFAALDEITRTDMRHLVTGLCEPLGTTILFVTHSIAEAVFLSDRVAVLSSRPGTIVGVEPVDLARPRSPGLEDDPAFFAIERRLRALLHEGMGR
jgi:NitT/TauT family transport system ATP-binding protein